MGLWGVFWQSHWFQQPWESQEALTSQCIAIKEMLPILLSCAIWGKHWHGKHIQFQSDNEAVITALDTKSCKDTSLIHVLHCLFFFRHTTPFHTQQGISLVLTTHWLMLYHVTMLLCFFQRFPMWTKPRLTSPRN